MRFMIYWTLKVHRLNISASQSQQFIDAYLLDRSSSSPPLFTQRRNVNNYHFVQFAHHCPITHHPQKEFEKPLTVLNCFVVIDETPPKIEEYGNLRVRSCLLKSITIAPPEKFSLESKSVNRDAHVARLIGTSIQVSVVQRKQVDIVENKTVPFIKLQRLDEADIHQLRSIE